jgi:hypothetical protein
MRTSLLIVELLRAGNRVRFRVRGSSMRGALRSGDVVEATPVKIAQLNLGDIVLYEQHGRLVAHRLVGVVDAPSKGRRLIVRGDSLSFCDRPVPAYAVLGRVTLHRSDLPQRLIRSLSQGMQQLWQGSRAAAGS